jgi:hypothetical protein
MGTASASARERAAGPMHRDVAAAAASGPARYYGGPRITYFDRSGFGPAVDEAAREWTAIGSRIRLVKVHRARKAKIIVASVAKLRLSRTGEIAGRGGPGKVILSRRALNGSGLVRQADVVAHELGHALGLAHSGGACDVMYHASETWSCRSRADRYRCGPGAQDVRQLARIWRWRPKVDGRTGYCEFKPPAAELTADDVPEVTLPPDFRTQRTLHLFMRNTSNERWVDETLAVPTDAEGRYLDTGCVDTDGSYVATEMQNEDPVEPGEVADFEVYVCGNPGETRAFHFRLASKWFRPTPFVFGPRWTVTVHFRAGMPAFPGLPPGYGPPPN